MPQSLESPFTRPMLPRGPEQRSYLDGPQRSWSAMLISIAICHAAGLLGVLTGSDGMRSRWYRKLRKPEFTPPSSAFGPVWSALYTMMGVALYKIWQKRSTPEGKSALKWFGAQLLLNASWTPAFFRNRSITGGLGVISALAAVLPISIGKANQVSRPAGWLLLPYFAWVAFATVLNGALAAMNPRQVRKETRW